MDRFKGMTLLGGAMLAAYLAGSWVNRAPAQDESSHVPLVSPATAAPASLIAQATKGFVCPMHEHITSDHEGDCPICGMDLVAQKNPNAVGGVNQSALAARSSLEHVPPQEHVQQQTNLMGAPVHIGTGIQANLGVRIAQVERGDLARMIETVGKITRVDSSARVTLASPITGRLEYIAEKVEGDTVLQGELLFSIVSDELLELERAYAAAAKSSQPDEISVLVAGLMDQGLSAEQIEQLHTGAEPNMPANFYAPQNGYVFTRRGNAGDEVGPGFTVFNVGGDKRLVEVTAEIFEQQWGWVQEGQDAEMTVRGLPGVVFSGSVVRVDPPVGFTTRTLEVRAEFETDDEGVTQNVFGRIRIKGQVRSDLVTVPSEAVIRTEAGDRVVKVGKDGTFQTVSIVAGEEVGGRTEVMSGLAAGESIVVSGQFLIDSESSRLADLARLAPGVANAAAGGHHH